MKRQRGTTTVEFAIIATALFMVLFSVIEVARVFFVVGTVAEATRRGARVAVVCPVNHGAVARIAVFNEPDGGDDSTILNGLSTANVFVEYLDENEMDASASYPAIRYVRVGINNYQHTLLIPFLTLSVTVPPFSTTLPAESLGYIPPPMDQRACFGSAA